jgi:hypothetical protein
MLLDVKHLFVKSLLSILHTSPLRMEAVGTYSETLVCTYKSTLRYT